MLDQQPPAFGYAPRDAFLPAHDLFGKGIRMLVLVCHRRAGKSTFGAFSLVSSAVNRAGAYAWVSPRVATSWAVGMPIVRAMLEGMPHVKWRLVEKTVEIVTPSGEISHIHFLGSEDTDTGGGLRGRGLIGVYADEIAQIGADDFWSSLMPTQANIADAWMIAAGTPRSEDLLLDLFRLGQTRDNWASIIMPASETGIISAQELAEIAATMPEAQYLREFECDFDATAPNQLIARSYVVAAQTRDMPETRKLDILRTLPVTVGWDFAMQSDDAVGVAVCGPIMLEYVRLPKPTMSEIGFAVKQMVDKYRAEYLFTDSGNIGVSVNEYLRALALNPIGVNFGGRADDPERFANKRAEMFFRLKEWCERDDTVLPPDDLYVTKQLTVSRYEIDASNRLKLEDKSKIRKRLGGNSSPDLADAAALCFAIKHPAVSLDGDPIYRRQHRTGHRPGDLPPLVTHLPDGSKVYSSEALAAHRKRHRQNEVYDPFDDGLETFDVWGEP